MTTKHNQLCLVKWKDHEEFGGGWISREDAEVFCETKVREFSTVGFVLENNPIFIVLAGTKNCDCYGSLNKILKSTITDMEVLDYAKEDDNG